MCYCFDSKVVAVLGKFGEEYVDAPKDISGDDDFDDARRLTLLLSL